MAWLSKLFTRKSGQRSVLFDDASTAAGLQRARGNAGPRGDEPSLPRFHGSASDKMYAMRGSALEKARFRLRNAFTPSQPVVSSKMFAGRTEVLKTLIRSIEDQRLHVILYGNRGIGKTSLLHILAQLAQDARYIVRYTSCGEGTDFSDMFRAVTADIPLLYHKDFDPTSEEIEKRQTLGSLLPPGPVGIHQISDLFAKLSGTRVLIIIDEFDRAESLQFRRAIAELIKNLSDRSIRVQLLIAGVAANLTELIEHIPSIRRNILGLQVPNMSSDELEQLIQMGETASGLQFDREVVSFISTVASGSPYIASLLSQHAGLSAIEREASIVEKEDVDEAVRRAVEEIRHRVSMRSMHAIQKAFDAGDGYKLGVMARAAVHSGGRIATDVLAKVQSDGGTGLAYAKLIQDQYGLIAPLPEDPTGAWYFCEEGVPVYLWMRLAEDKLTN